jgi:hypothetical protein
MRERTRFRAAAELTTPMDWRMGRKTRWLN